jgi:hypothetical protein
MARGTQVKSNITAAQPAGFDMPRAQPPVTPAPPIVKQKEPVMVPIKQEPISSLASPFDTQADPFVSTVDTDVQEVDGKAAILKDKEARLAAYGTNSVRDVYAQLLAEAPNKARTGRDLYREFDPGRGAMQGYNAETYNQAVNIDRPLAQAMEDFEIPAYVEYKVPELDTGGLEYDKTRLYTNYGQRGQLEFPSQEARDEYYEKERTGTFHDISKLLGITDVGIDSQTMVWVKDPPKPSKWEKFLGNPVLSLVGALYPPVALATTGLKAASGMDVSPVEIASGLMAGLNMSGVTAPPSASAMPAGQMGPGVANTGRGLFGTTYAQTQTALNVAAAGDVKGAALALVGQPLINRGLDSVGLDQATIEGAGIQYDDFQEGLGQVVSAVAGGAELDEALAQGLGKYIREGGTLGSIDLPETNIDLGVVEDVVRNLVRPLGEAGTALADFVDDAVIRPVGDVLSALDTAVRDALPDIDLPSVDLPRIDLPSVDLPRIDLPSVDLPSVDLTMSEMMATASGAVPMSSTRTTDSLFADELFKFKTKVEDTQELVPFSTLEFGDVQTMPYVYEDIQSPLSEFTYDNGLELNIPQQLTQEELLQELFQKQGVSL